MISKLAKPFPFLISLPKFTSFYHSTHQFNNQTTEPLGIDNCFNIKQILIYFSNNTEMPDSDFIRVCTKMVKIKHTNYLGVNYKKMIQKIETINFEDCQFETFVSICNVLSLMVYSEVVKSEVFTRILARIKNSLLKSPEKLSIESLLSFFELAILHENKLIINSICDILMRKTSELKSLELLRYLEIVDKAKLPNLQEKEMFTRICQRVNSEINRFSSWDLIMLYRGLKNINTRVYNTSNLAEEIQQRIEHKLNDLELKDMNLLVNFKSRNNPFLKIIHNRIYNSLNDEGESELDPIICLEVLSKLSDSEEIVCFDNSFPKLLKFIHKNIEHDTHIKRIIKNSYFTKAQLESITKLINNLDDIIKIKYQSSYGYLNELRNKNILDLENYKHFLEIANRHNDSSEINEKLIVEALIINALHIKNNENEQIAQLHNQLTEIIKANSKLPIKFNPLTLSKKEIGEDFTVKYWKIFHKNIFDEIINGEEKLKDNHFYFALLGNDTTHLKKLKEINKIPPGMIKNMIFKINSHPQSFKGSFKEINKLIEQFINESTNLKIVKSYLCNWEVHLIHEPHEVESFFELASKALDKMKINLSDFYTYLIETPQTSFRSSLAYIKFLFSYQKTLIERNEEENKDQKRSTPVILISEFIRFKVLNEKFAKIILEQNFLRNEGMQKVIKTFCQILAKQKSHHELVAFDNRYLFFYARFSELFDLQSGEKLNQLLNRVDQATIFDLENILLNFSLAKSNESETFINHVLNAYIKKLNKHRNVFLSIIQNLEKYSLSSEQYKKFIEIVVNSYTRYWNIVSLSNLAILFKEANQRKIPITNLSIRILGALRVKLNKNQSIIETLFPVLGFFLLSCPQKTVELFLNVRNKTFLNQFLREIELINLESPEIFSALSQILTKNLKEKPTINKGIFNYLVSKKEEFKNFESNLTLAFYYDSQCTWLREELRKFLIINNIDHSHYEEKEHEGFTLLNIANKKFLFIDKMEIDERKQKMLEIAAFIFELGPEEREKLRIIFTGPHLNKRAVSELITSGNTQLTQKSLSEMGSKSNCSNTYHQHKMELHEYDIPNKYFICNETNHLSEFQLIIFHSFNRLHPTSYAYDFNILIYLINDKIRNEALSEIDTKHEEVRVEYIRTKNFEMLQEVSIETELSSEEI